MIRARNATACVVDGARTRRDSSLWLLESSSISAATRGNVLIPHRNGRILLGVSGYITGARPFSMYDVNVIAAPSPNTLVWVVVDRSRGSVLPPTGVLEWSV